MEQFYKDVHSLSTLLKKSTDLINTINNEKDPNVLIEHTFTLERLSERIANTARLLPHISGIKEHEILAEDIMIEEMDITIALNERGWYVIKIPSLLPKKEKGNASYIRAAVFKALERYFANGHDVKFDTKTILCFNHIYSLERPWRHMRDHDNIEINVIVDAIALFLLKDDGPTKCNHYHKSEKETTPNQMDRTEITLLPEKDFSLFLTLEKKRWHHGD